MLVVPSVEERAQKTAASDQIKENVYEEEELNEKEKGELKTEEKKLSLRVKDAGQHNEELASDQCDDETKYAVNTFEQKRKKEKRLQRDKTEKIPTSCSLSRRQQRYSDSFGRDTSETIG